MIKRLSRIAWNSVKVICGAAGIGAAAIGLAACFSPVDWPLGAVLVLTGATVFSVAAGVLRKKLYLFIIPAAAAAGWHPVAIVLPWMVVKWTDRHYRRKAAKQASPRCGSLRR